MVCSQRRHLRLITHLGARRVAILAFALMLVTAFSAVAADNDEAYEWLEPGRILQAQQAMDDVQAAYPGVRAYRLGQLVTRLYGREFGTGTSPIATAEAFKLSHAQVFGTNPNELVAGKIDNPEQLTQQVMYDKDTDTYKFTLVYYHQVRDGVPVHDAELRLLVRNEPNYPLVLAVSSLRDLGQAFLPDRSKVGGVNQMAISAALLSEPGIEEFGDQKTVVWAGVDDQVTQPRTAVEFVGTADDGKWIFIVDANTGEIISKESGLIDVDVAGSVEGLASQGLASEQCTEELAEALPYARVNIGSNIAYTDENGDFNIPNLGSTDVVVESRLWGQWYRVFNYTGSDVVLVDTVTPPGPAGFVHNATNTTEQVRAQVNAYYQANLQRDYLLQFNPSYPTLNNPEFPIYTNRTDIYCPGNAWYDQIEVSMNFCQSGSGYPNTAWSSVLHHEFGHHLVQVAGSGQGQYGEGMGDCMSVIMADDPRLGLGFFGDCLSPLRNADNTMQYPCSDEAHACAPLLSGAVWDTRNALVVTEPVDYLSILSNLTINSILLHTGSLTTPQITIDFLTLDDDDANLDNGTPHWNEIDEGFGLHNMPAPELQPILFEYPNGRPDFLLPDTATTVLVNVEANAVAPVQTTGQAFYSIDGGAYQAAAMNEIAPNQYEISFPQVICGNTVTWYMSSEADGFGTVTDPSNAPATVYTAITATASYVELQDNFETNLGWTVGGSVSDGQWTRGVPVGGGDRGDPASDYDGSGACYVTDNVDGDSDVDGGTTILYSPTIDLTDAADARISYARWYSNNFGADPNNDQMNIYISNDDGSNWTLVETVGPAIEANGGWYHRSFFVADFVTPTATVKMRFDASDLGSGSVVEAGVDAFEVVKYECNSTDLAIVTFEVPDWTVGMPYSVQLATINGVGQVTYVDVNDDLSGTGLTLSPTGLLSGTPTGAGMIDFIAQATDEQPQVDEQALSFEINPAVDVQTAVLSEWTRGQSYPATQLSSTGGTGAIAWLDADNGLSGTGMALTATGTLQGIPSAAGTVSFMAQATDVAGSSDQEQMTVEINPAVSVTTTSLNAATLNELYSFQLVGTGGTGPISWSDENGDLAGSGLSISTSGLLSGTPTVETTINLTVRASDSTGSSDLQPLSLQITSGCCQGTSVGNVDGSADLAITIGDLTALVDVLFVSLTPPDCLEEADLDYSGQPNPTVADITIGDLTLLVDNLFISLAPLSPCP